MRYSGNTIPDYLDSLGEPQRTHIQQIIGLMAELLPEVQPSISYGMPAWKFKGKPLAYTGAYPGHIGFYATPNSHAAFQPELTRYKQGKGSVQFPLQEPMPLDLIRRMVQFRMQQIQEGKK